MFDNKELARNASGLTLKDDESMPDMAAMRQYRLGRLQTEIQSCNCAAATGTRSMQIFGMHHPTRVAVVPPSGGVTLFGWSGGGFEPETVNEIRPSPLAGYFPSGTRSETRIKDLAKEIAAVVRELGAGDRAALDISEPGCRRSCDDNPRNRPRHIASCRRLAARHRAPPVNDLRPG